jgi:PAS fold
VHPEDRGGVDAFFQAAIRGESNGEYASEYRAVRPNGTVRWIVSKGRVIFNLVGGVERAVRFAGTAMDISDSVRLEEQIRDTQKLESLGAGERKPRAGAGLSPEVALRLRTALQWQAWFLTEV